MLDITAQINAATTLDELKACLVNLQSQIITNSNTLISVAANSHQDMADKFFQLGDYFKNQGSL